MQPLTDAKVPYPQLAHANAPSAEVKPAAQAVQADAPLVDANNPEAHKEHAVDPDESDENIPGAQLSQLNKPLVEEKVPWAQEMQLDAPAVFWY